MLKTAREILKKRCEKMLLTRRIKAFITDIFMIYMPILYVMTYAILGSKESLWANQGAIFACFALYAVILSAFFARGGQSLGYKYAEIALVCVDSRDLNKDSRLDSRADSSKDSRLDSRKDSRRESKKISRKKSRESHNDSSADSVQKSQNDSPKDSRKKNPTFLRALARFLIFSASFALVFGMIFPFFRKDGAFLHDILCKLCVQKAQKS